MFWKPFLIFKRDFAGIGKHLGISRSPSGIVRLRFIRFIIRHLMMFMSRHFEIFRMRLMMSMSTHFRFFRRRLMSFLCRHLRFFRRRFIDYIKRRLLIFLCRHFRFFLRMHLIRCIKSRLISVRTITSFDFFLLVSRLFIFLLLFLFIRLLRRRQLLWCRTGARSGAPLTTRSHCWTLFVFHLNIK
jgi:hypothetical protein